ncbi:hypothetical protein ABT390_04785 [Streptomyces aurantiacus]|uniref:Lipoprotein n=1 Tax=Streptomyces aurantiacus JA 4570 TaxID=1286094 RepID=S3ZWR1_9ACTN|nr:hypothetical protein [Streptomyces aurantiacus]EPH42875.1 hypothetical protein STRAU_4071 [Streptomyces aurantiacus JA 4570]
MLSKKTKPAMLFTSFAAAGTLLLTACGGGDDGGDAKGAGKAADRAGANAPAADGQAGGGSGTMNLSLPAGTAEQNNARRGTGDWANPPGKPATKPVQRKWVQLSAGSAGNLAPVVVNGAGFTLYRFDKDTAQPSESNCAGACATTWPPVLVDPGGKIFVDGVRPSDVGVIKRDDGTRQVTIGGWPVYRFSKDLKPGDTNGHGVGGTWFGVTPNGQKSGQPAGGDGTQAGDGAGQDEAGRAAPATSAILFDNADFADPAQGVAGEGCQNVARPKVASSLSAAGSLKLWSRPDCKGESKVVNGDVADLRTIDFDDKVSSIAFG